MIHSEYFRKIRFKLLMVAQMIRWYVPERTAFIKHWKTQIKTWKQKLLAAMLPQISLRIQARSWLYLRFQVNDCRLSTLTHQTICRHLMGFPVFAYGVEFGIMNCSQSARFSFQYLMRIASGKNRNFLHISFAGLIVLLVPTDGGDGKLSSLNFRA